MIASLFLDSQLLVLFLVGATSKELIGTHKRLRAYSIEDFELLDSIARRAQKIVVTPNTLTEASNLIRQISEPHATNIGRSMQALIGGAYEMVVSSQVAAEHIHFLRLGLTDVVAMEACAAETTLLTADLDLYLAASRGGVNAINFNYAREAGGIL